VTVRDMVRAFQREIRETPDLLPDRAADILTQLCSLLGNCNDEIRAADAAFAAVLLQHLESEEKANRARIRALHVRANTDCASRRLHEPTKSD